MSYPKWPARVAKVLALIATAAALAGCNGEESNQPPQTPPVRIETTGVVTDGASTRTQTIYAKGATGLTRMVTAGAGGQYTVSMTELTGPFLFSNSLSPGADPELVFMAAPATRVGVVNVTPLTTLLTAQLFGLDPGNAVTSFSSGSPLIGQVSDATILAAQADVTAYLQDVVGVQVKSGTASFIDSPFKPVAGDSMHDTIQALGAKLASSGTTLKALGAQIALGVRACQTEAIQVTLNGQRKPFCPVIKSAVPEEADITIIDYVFKNVANDTLTVKVRANTVLSAEFVTTAGQSYQCADTTCGGISVGAPAADLSRDLVFASAPFTAASGSALLDGTLGGPTPSVTLPLLPCTDNRFYVIFENHDVVADCVDTLNPLGIPGTFNGAAGPGRDAYSFSNTAAALPITPRLEVVLDNATPQPTVVSVYYTDIDPDTSELRNRFVCQLAACNGVTVGPVSVNNSAGFPIEVMTLTLNNVMLSGVNADGTSTGTTVTLRGSFTALRDPSQVASYPPLAPCDPAGDTINVVAFAAEFNLCIPQNDLINFFIYRSAFDLGTGETQLLIGSDMGDQVSLIVRNDNGALVETLVTPGSTGEQFKCTTNCTGVTVSAPDGAGERTVTFTNSVIHRLESFPLPGDRSITVNSPAVSVPPP